MIYRATYLLFALLPLGCGASRDAAKEKAGTDPEWTRSKPIDPQYYRGIGVARVAPDGSHLHRAKNLALSDLSSEISVEISSSTTHRQRELNKKFSEEFRALTEISTLESLEDFELVGTWEADDHYWVHYRLDRATYARHRAQRKAAAIERSLAYYTLAQKFRSEYQYPDALSYTMQAMELVKPYLAEEMHTDSVVGDYSLALFGLVQDLISDIRIHAPQTRMTRMRFADPGPPQPLFEISTANGTPLTGISVYLYYTGGFLRENQVRSDEGGFIYVGLPVLSNSNNHERLEADLNLVALAERSTRDPLLRAIITRQTGARAELGIDVRAPQVHIRSEELITDSLLNEPPLTQALRRYLLSNGYKVTEHRNAADLHINIRARAESTGAQDGFFTAQLRGELVLSDSENHTLASFPLNSFRGVQLSQSAAGQDAFRRAVREMEDHGFRKLLAQ